MLSIVEACASLMRKIGERDYFEPAGGGLAGE